MAIQHIIVHEIRRVKEDKKSTETLIAKIKDTENDLSSLSGELAAQLLKLFSSSSLMVGQFSIGSDAEKKPAFEQGLENFYSGEKCLDFVEMTRELAEFFKTFLVSNKTITGGFLVFFEFKGDEHTKLAVAVINKSNATDIDPNLDFIAKEILDLDKLHLGATINITEWRDEFAERYIRFKSGQSEEVTEYFQKFIGCEVDKKAAAEETKKLREAIDKFASEKLKLSQEEVDQYLSAAYEYINECIKKGDDVVLENISKRVFPAASDAFFEFASDGHNLSGIIKINTTELRTFMKLSSKRKDLSITFSRELLHNKINFENDILKIDGSLLSESLIAELRAASPKNDQDE
ncbi:nucleoid-associated protein [Acinetobacter sp. AOR34_HL]|uniref:nucleoid-associated protein n=1 Tax=Acinetobacter sp. AOR34_HL TaxID=2919384 RepID=UPI0022EB3A62|nr:nucleoid-associated protein [Acinetobacter sp. AOR34_HL]MDA3502250.1 nucleoid-associated protein [Acinetobacter sp. AOR34_HL]